jgi:hypothetical protein
VDRLAGSFTAAHATRPTRHWLCPCVGINGVVAQWRSSSFAPAMSATPARSSLSVSLGAPVPGARERSRRPRAGAGRAVPVVPGAVVCPFSEEAGFALLPNEVVDPDGRRVVLDAAGWRHIVDEHVELASHGEAVLATVRGPDHRGSDPRPGREPYWRRGLGPTRWLMVVVGFVAVPARVVTAYGNRKDPPGWTP